MLVTQVNEWGSIISSVADGTRPASAMGTSITPGNNTYGSYTQLLAGASLTDDAYGILINVNSNNVSAAARDTLMTIGFDAAGGSSYTDFITDLICSNATVYTQSAGGIWYYFPIFIKAGTSIAAKASVNNATVGTLNAFVRLYCKPSCPEAVKVGSYVTTFGATTASSSGTAITPGTASEGAWTQIGSALTKPHWYWQVGFGANDAAMVANVYDVDVGVGDASNKKVLISNLPVITSAIESCTWFQPAQCSGFGATGDIVYARAQVGPSAADSSLSVAVYAVGG
jgi:hypothetical protein